MSQINVCLSNISPENTPSFCLQLSPPLSLDLRGSCCCPFGPSCCPPVLLPEPLWSGFRPPVLTDPAHSSTAATFSEKKKYFSASLCAVQVWLLMIVCWMMEACETISLRELRDVVGQTRLRSADCPFRPFVSSATRQNRNPAGDDSCLPDFPCSKSGHSWYLLGWGGDSGSQKTALPLKVTSFFRFTHTVSSAVFGCV